MFPYLSLFTFAAALAAVLPGRFQKRSWLGGKGLYILLTVALVLFAGLRYETGFDYGNYLNNWWQPAQDLIFILSHNKEPVIPLLWNLSGTVGLSYQGGLLLVAALSIGIKAYVISYYSPHPLLSLVILVGDFYLIQEMGQIRSGLAMSFLALSVHFNLKNKHPRSFLFFLTGCLTHIASLPFLAFYFVRFIRLQPTFACVFACLFLFLSALYLSTEHLIPAIAQTNFGRFVGVSGYTLRVLENVEPRSFFTLGTFFSLIILVISLHWRQQLRKKSEFFDSFLWLYAIGIIFIIASATYLGDPAARAARIFLFYQCLIIPLWATILRPRECAFIMIYFAGTVYALLKLLLVLFKRTESFIPYLAAPPF